MKSTWLVTLVAASSIMLLSAQAPVTKHSLDVAVIDPKGRLITGLDQSQFDVIENGAHRTISGFADQDTPIAIAVVGAETIDATGILSPSDQLFRSSSWDEAVHRLQASSASRKVLVHTGVTPATAPPGIEALAMTNLIKDVIRVKNQYHLEFEGSTGPIEVILKQTTGLPPLTVAWK